MYICLHCGHEFEQPSNRYNRRWSDSDDSEQYCPNCGSEDFEEAKNKQYKNSIQKLLPSKMIPIIIKLSEINPDKQVNEITREEMIQEMANCVKNIQENEDYMEKIYEVCDEIFDTNDEEFEKLFKDLDM